MRDGDGGWGSTSDIPTIPLEYRDFARVSQLHGDRWHPVVFLSMKQRGLELRYNTPDAEMFAALTAFRPWRYYLVYPKETIEVITDHLNHSHLSGKLSPADALSRRADHNDGAGKLQCLHEDLPER